MADIRRAVEHNLRPTAVMSEDHHIGHRDRVTGRIADTGWTRWDFRLFDAFCTVEDFTTKTGLLIWEVEGEGVEVSAERKTDPFEAAKARATGRKSYKPRPGEYFVPDVHLIPGYEKWPTITDWRVAEIKKRLPPELQER